MKNRWKIDEKSRENAHLQSLPCESHGRGVGNGVFTNPSFLLLKSIIFDRRFMSFNIEITTLGCLCDRFEGVRGLEGVRDLRSFIIFQHTIHHSSAQNP